MERTTTRAATLGLAALLGLLALAGPSAGASRIGVGKMTVTPDRVFAGSTENELTLTKRFRHWWRRTASKRLRVVTTEFR